MQKLWYLAVMGIFGCVSVNAAMAQTPKPSANKPALANVDPRAFVSGAAAKPSIASNQDMAAAQVPAMRSSSTNIVDAATRAAAKPHGWAAAKGASGGSIASAASMAARGSLPVGTTHATPAASIARLALQAPSKLASASGSEQSTAVAGVSRASALTKLEALQTLTVAPTSGRQLAAKALAAKAMVSMSAMNPSRRRSK